MLVFPDTTILISLHQELEAVGAFTIHALWSDRSEPIDALRDLVQLWWWRDVRFLVSATHLRDARKPMTAQQKLARQAAVFELGQDFEDRGDYRPIIDDDAVVDDWPCALHSVRVSAMLDGDSVLNIDPPLPTQGQDEQLVYDALNAEAHVFVTTDKKILRCHKSFFNLGLAIMSPVTLMEELDESRELDDCDALPDSIAPDISALARFYGAFATDCFNDSGH